MLTIGIFAFQSVISSVFLIGIFCEPMEYAWGGRTGLGTRVRKGTGSHPFHTLSFIKFVLHTGLDIPFRILLIITQYKYHYYAFYTFFFFKKKNSR